MKAFLEAVDSAYREADEERSLIERSMDIVSQEMSQRYAELEQGQKAIDRVSREKAEVQLLLDALAKSERRYRRVLETSYEGIWILDTEGKTVFANQRMADILGYERNEMPGRSLLEFVPEQESAITNATIRRGREELSELSERLLVRKDGSQAVVLISNAPMEDDEGRYTGTLKMVTDITDRKESERALRASEAKLHQAQKMEAVGRFAGGIAHDFNNLLTAILGFTDMLLMEIPADSPWRTDLEEIRNASQRATALSRQILSFSRGTAVQPAVLDVNTIVLRLESMLRRLLGSAITLVVATDPDASNILIDESQFEQIVLNLVLNAKDAMPSGGIVTVDVSRETVTQARPTIHGLLKPGEYARLSVTDSGSGIPLDKLGQIFEPFFTTKVLGHSTGLGLSIVKSVVQDAGGAIELETALDKGTTFHAYFPISQSAARQPEQSAEGARIGGAETILVVDDEEPIRVLAGKVLRKYGYTVLEARHGRDALMRVKSHRGNLDVVLTDVVMPEMDGPALLDELRKIRPGLGMVIMSGYAAREVGPFELADDTLFLRKPFDTALLLQTIRQAVDSRSKEATTHAV